MVTITVLNDKVTILNLLNKFSSDHKNITWKLNCAYSDGMGTTINQIKIFAPPGNRTIGVFSYQVESGKVLFCLFKSLTKTKSEGIVDMLLDLINYSKRLTIL